MRYIWLHIGYIWWWRKIFESLPASSVFSITSCRCIGLLWLEIIWMSAIKGVCFTRHSKEKRNCNSCYSTNIHTTIYSILNDSFLMKDDQVLLVLLGAVCFWNGIIYKVSHVSSAVVIKTHGIFMQARIVLDWWFNFEWTCEGHLDQEHQCMGQSWQQEYLWVQAG